MPEIQSPDPGRKLQRRYNLIGSTPAPFLSPELVPVVLIDDLTEQAPGVLWATAGGQQGPSAGNNSYARLANPLNSGVLLEEISLRATMDTSSNWTLEDGTSVFLAFSLTPAWQDRALPGRPVGRISRDATAYVAANQLAQGYHLANRTVEIDFPNMVLPEGQGINFIVQTVSVGLFFWYKWAERQV